MTFRPIHEKDDLYFVTGTIIEWTSIFSRKEYRNIVIESLKWLVQENRMKIFAFVIMSNHLHWISYPIPPATINGNLWSFASYTAHGIMRIAKKNNDRDFINVFSKHAKRGKSHRIWKDFQAKNIVNSRFLFQKMEYIHNNPLGKYNLEARSDFLFSSARYYDKGKASIIPIDDIYDFIDEL